MTTPLVVTAVILGFLLAETRVSRRHERLLREQGGIAPRGDVYPLMAVVYPGAFVVMGLEGAWRASQAASLPEAGAPAWLLSGVLLFAAAKAVKYWAIATLGVRWTFKVVVVPGAALLRAGPYRYVAHPNYLGVLGELAGAAMMVGAPVSGPTAFIAFGLLLWARVRFEARAHASARMS
jgi:methyltransferase